MEPADHDAGSEQLKSPAATTWMQAEARDRRVKVPPRLLTLLQWLMIGAGVWWWYSNPHPGDLVRRTEALALVLGGLWIGRIARPGRQAVE
jgi:hypothetical protein